MGTHVDRKKGATSIESMDSCKVAALALFLVATSSAYPVVHQKEAQGVYECPGCTQKPTPAACAVIHGCCKCCAKPNPCLQGSNVTVGAPPPHVNEICVTNSAGFVLHWEL